MVIFVVAIPKTIPFKRLPWKAASAGTASLLDATAAGFGDIERGRRRGADLNARDLLQGHLGELQAGGISARWRQPVRVERFGGSRPPGNDQVTTAAKIPAL